MFQDTNKGERLKKLREDQKRIQEEKKRISEQVHKFMILLK